VVLPNPEILGKGESVNWNIGKYKYVKSFIKFVPCDLVLKSSQNLSQKWKNCVNISLLYYFCLHLISYTFL